MTSPHLDRNGPNSHDEDDRYGLDMLAEAIDDVAAQLPPSNLVPMTSPEARRSTPPESPRPATRHPHSPTAAGNPTKTRWMALAAAVLIALLAWPAYLGWVQLPRVEMQLAEARAAQGPVELIWLSPPRQGERTMTSAAPTRLRVPGDGSMVWLLELPSGLRPQLQQGAQIELRPTFQDASGVHNLQWSLDADTLAANLTQHDGVPLLLHGKDLPPGPYELHWLDLGGETLSSVAVELVKP